MKGTCNVVSAFARFVPVGFPVVDHLYAAIVMFSISIVQVVHMVVVFYSYKPSAVFTATAPKWTPVLSLFAANIMLFPSVCVFFYGCYHAKTQYGPLLIFFAAVSACVQFTGVYILVTCDIAFPSFRRGFGSFWVTPNYVIFVFYIVLLVGLIEGTPSITNKNGKLTVEIDELTRKNSSLIEELSHKNSQIKHNMIQSENQLENENQQLKAKYSNSQTKLNSLI